MCTQRLCFNQTLSRFFLFSLRLYTFLFIHLFVPFLNLSIWKCPRMRRVSVSFVFIFIFVHLQNPFSIPFNAYIMWWTETCKWWVAFLTVTIAVRWNGKTCKKNHHKFSVMIQREIEKERWRKKVHEPIVKDPVPLASS